MLGLHMKKHKQIGLSFKLNFIEEPLSNMLGAQSGAVDLDLWYDIDNGLDSPISLSMVIYKWLINYTKDRYEKT